MRSSTNSDLRAEIVYLLGRLNTTSTITAIRMQMEKESNPQFLRLIELALAKQESGKELKDLIQRLTDSDAASVIKASLNWNMSSIFYCHVTA